MEQTDLDQVARARSGDTEAFRSLVERHSRSLFRLAYRMTGNQQDAEDVVQESFLRAYKQLSKFDERASFGTWLYRIAMNCSLDLVRARKRRNEQMAPAESERGGAGIIAAFARSRSEPPRALGRSPRPRDRRDESLESFGAHGLRAAPFRTHVH